MFVIIPAQATEFCKPVTTPTGKLIYSTNNKIIYNGTNCSTDFSLLLEWLEDIEDPAAIVSIIGKVPVTAKNFTGFYKGFPLLAR